MRKEEETKKHVGRINMLRKGSGATEKRTMSPREE